MTIQSYDELKREMKNWEIGHFPLRDGAQLRYGLWQPAQPAQGHVLLIPGRAEFIEKYTEEAAEWADRGYKALCLDLRGQGGSTRIVPHRSHIDSFDTYVSDLAEFWQKVWQPAAGQGFAAIQAHSTGAHIALRHLATAPQAADALIVTAPMFDIATDHLPRLISPQMAHRIVVAMRHVAPTAYALGQNRFEPRPFAGNPLTNDERRYTEWNQLQQELPDLTTGGASWGWVAAAQRSRPQLEAALPHVKTPTLALLTPHDRVVDGPAQYQLTNAIRLEFPNEGHELLRAPDNTRARIWRSRDDFIFITRQQLPDWRKKQLAPGL